MVEGIRGLSLIGRGAEEMRLRACWILGSGHVVWVLEFRVFAPGLPLPNGPPAILYTVYHGVPYYPPPGSPIMVI